MKINDQWDMIESIYKEIPANTEDISDVKEADTKALNDEEKEPDYLEDSKKQAPNIQKEY